MNRIVERTRQKTMALMIDRGLMFGMILAFSTVIANVNLKATFAFDEVRFCADCANQRK